MFLLYSHWRIIYITFVLLQGADIFASRVHIEVQHASEATIAAVERNGGMITTRFFNLECVQALNNPEVFFKKGVPIPRCALPPPDAFEYYTDPNVRGYLADPDKVKEARYALAQKYGYEMPDYENAPNPELFKSKKDPRQIFLGLVPGWVVCLRDKVILKPKDPEYLKYYESWTNFHQNVFTHLCFSCVMSLLIKDL